jgi:glycosyltransferase involved in cell wall biosynthesis
MPTRNAMPYLDEAVRSILAQSHADFEFVILDDGSDDGSRERLRFWAAADSRIRLIESERSLGPVGSSNLVVQSARAPVIARMDADDVSTPDRLERQLELLTSHPDIVLVGSVWEGIDREGRMVREADCSKVGENGFAAPFAHGSVMFRRDAFLRAGGYRLETAYWEDLDLFLRIAGEGRVLVSSRPLYRHRFSETSTRLTSALPAVERAVDLMFRCRAAFERGEDYQRLLEPSAAGAPRSKLHPYTFLSMGFISLWSGHRPRSLQRLLSHGALRPDLVTMKALVWASWAAISPRSLRKVMQWLLRLRNRRTFHRRQGEAVEWRPRLRPARGRTLSGSAAAPGGNSANLSPAGAPRGAIAPAGGRDK